MLIANQKREENIAEYLLYMWQIEDIIRANKLDIDLIQKNVIDKFDLLDNVRDEMRIWYQNLIEMMIHESVTETGHLQVNKNVILNLTDLHQRLLAEPQESLYISNYYKTLPFIVELRSKNEDKNISEIETCFSALYGFLLLRLQQKDISGETQAAISQISSFIRLLSHKYKEEKEGTLNL